MKIYHSKTQPQNMWNCFLTKHFIEKYQHQYSWSQLTGKIASGIWKTMKRENGWCQKKFI